MLLAKDADTLLEPVTTDDEHDHHVRSTDCCPRCSCATTPRASPCVLAGRWALLAEQERWAEGRYLAVDLQLVADRNDTKGAARSTVP